MGQNLFMLRRGSPMRPHNESDAPFVWTSSVYVLLDDSRAFIFTPSNRVGATHPVHEQSTPHYPITRECQRCACPIARAVYPSRIIMMRASHVEEFIQKHLRRPRTASAAFGVWVSYIWVMSV